jgi:hypothetical protein
MPAVGGHIGPWEYGSLDKFLLALPAFRFQINLYAIAPPLHVVNEILATGKDDAGMGGGAEWKPFQISSEEYEEVILQWATVLPNGISKDTELEKLPNYFKWHMATLRKYAKRNKKQS